MGGFRRRAEREVPGCPRLVRRRQTDNFTAYKLLIADVVDGRLVAVPRGIMAAANVMQGGRAGVDLPADEADG